MCKGTPKVIKKNAWYIYVQKILISIFYKTLKIKPHVILNFTMLFLCNTSSFNSEFEKRVLTIVSRCGKDSVKKLE